MSGRWKYKPTIKLISFGKNGQKVTKTIPQYGRKFEETKKRFLEKIQMGNLSATTRYIPVSISDHDTPGSSSQLSTPALVSLPGRTTTTKGRKRRLQQNYKEKQLNMARSWDRIRGSLHSAAADSLSPASLTCQLCCKIPAHIIRCQDCGPSVYLCPQCCHDHHRIMPTHSPEIWVDGKYFVPFGPRVKILRSPRICGNCDTLSSSMIKIINRRGIMQTIRIDHCACESVAVTLVRLGLWPLSPHQPRTAIAMELMELYRLLCMEGHISLQAFCSAIQILNEGNPAMINLYKCMKTEAASEYLHVSWHLRYPRMSEELPSESGTECPICSQTETRPKIVCLDGNFGLVRKKSSGQSVRQPFHANHFFLNQEDVDAFVDAQSNSAMAHDQDCSDFKAGDKLRSKARTVKLSETGIFGSVCRHELPVLFLNMKHGERLAYPVFMLKALTCDANLSPDDKLHVFYDISCRLEAHLRVNGETDLWSKLQFAVGRFHAYGHNASCQLKYNSHKNSGFLMNDGEAAERLWSYLSKFRLITKEMTPSNRHDVLVEGLMHWRPKLVSKLGDSLCQRITKAEMISADSERILLDLAVDKKVNGGLEEMISTAKIWCHEEQEQVANAKRHMSGRSADERKYVLALDKWATKRTMLGDIDNEEVYRAEAREVASLESTIHALEKKLRISDRWSLSSEVGAQILQKAYQDEAQLLLTEMNGLSIETKHLVDLKRKYSRGHNQSQKLTKSILRTQKQLRSKLQTYNSLRSVEPVQLQCVQDLSSPVYSQFTILVDSDDVEVQVSYSEKKIAITNMLLYKQTIAEISACKRELLALAQWYRLQQQYLLQSIAIAEKKCLNVPHIYAKLFALEHQMSAFSRRCEQYLTIELSEQLVTPTLDSFNENQLIAESL